MKKYIQPTTHFVAMLMAHTILAESNPFTIDVSDEELHESGFPLII